MNNEVENYDDPFGEIDGFDPNAQEVREMIFPRIQWVNGDKKLAGRGTDIVATGGFFIAKKEIAKASHTPNWEDSSVMFESGASSDGIGSAKGSFAVIRSRKCWVKETGGRRVMFPWKTKYEEGMKGWYQFLVAIRGCEEIFCFSAKNMVGIAFNEALGQHIKRTISEANKIAKQRRTQYAFWMNLKPGEFQQVGKEEGKKKWINPPEIFIPEKIERQYLVENYVGNETVLWLQEQFLSTADWAAQWNDANALQALGAVEETAGGYACGQVLADQYADLLAQLHLAGADTRAINDELIADAMGIPEQDWNAKEMENAIATLKYALKKRQSKVAVDAFA